MQLWPQQSICFLFGQMGLQKKKPKVKKLNFCKAERCCSGPKHSKIANGTWPNELTKIQEKRFKGLPTTKSHAHSYLQTKKALGIGDGGEEGSMILDKMWNEMLFPREITMSCLQSDLDAWHASELEVDSEKSNLAAYHATCVAKPHVQIPLP